MEIAITSNTNIMLLFIYKILIIILFYELALEKRSAYAKYCIIDNLIIIIVIYLIFLYD